MISSAVVIPDPPRERTPPPSSAHTLKRKLSHSLSSDSKRPRVQVDELQYDDEPRPQQDSRSPTSVQPNDQNNVSPTRRKSSAAAGINNNNTAVEEKKRNKRLFSGLLGTLSQTATKPAHKKRDEIESRQRERMRQLTEEEEERKRLHKAEVDQRRRKEQKLWDEEATRQRHRNMRFMAGFLKTKAEPCLYYRPWELRSEEEDDIVRQKGDVERTIRRELGEDEEMGDDRAVRNDRSDDHGDEQSQREPDDSDQGKLVEQQQDDAQTQQTSTDTKPDIVESVDAPNGSTNSNPTPQDPDEDKGKTEDIEKKPPASSETQDIQDPQPSRQEDHQGEELVEGQEDDVIY